LLWRKSILVTSFLTDGKLSGDKNILQNIMFYRTTIVYFHLSKSIFQLYIIIDCGIVLENPGSDELTVVVVKT
jgi:hypothetical protein